MKTSTNPQFDLYWAEHRKIAAQNRAFMEMLTDQSNPITDSDLKALIAKRPELYKHFSGFIGKLGETTR